MSPAPLGWILAGGRGLRMGGDKAFVPLGGRPLLATVLDRLAGQCDELVLNGDPARLAPFARPVVPDSGADRGPLAGLATAFAWVRALRPDCERILTAPLDTPFLPLDLAARLEAGRGTAPVAYATSAGRAHPVVASWSIAAADDVAAAAARGGSGRLSRWLDRLGAGAVAFDAGPPDPFFNCNTKADLVQAEGWLSAA